jgi:zinc protease
MRHTGLKLFSSILVALALCVAPALLVAQTDKPADEAKKGGTGIVPAGVKLAPQMPAGGAPRAYPFPKPVTRTLPNGLRVFVISDSEQPVVTARLVLPAAGSAQDPAGKTGAAASTSDLLTQGTAKRSAKQIAEAIDFVGGSLGASADSDGTYITVTVVKKDLALGLDLLSDVTRNAAFPDDEIERRREQALSSLRIQYSDGSYLASVIFSRVVFGDHAYGLPDEGTPDSLRALKRDDLVNFRDTYYVPAGAMLAFAGDITPAAAFAAAEKYFGSWTGKEPPASKTQVHAPHQGTRIILVDKPDAVQTQIRVGRLGISRNSLDYIPLAVTNRIFGGGFNSRLSTEVRIRKGLTYGANSSFDTRRQGGSFVASTSTRTEATVDATRLIVDLLQQMSTGSVTKEELDFARDYMAGVFPIQTEIAEQIAGRVLTVLHYGLPADYNDTYQQKVLAVDASDVQVMAGKYFSADSLDLVLVGNVGAFRDALKKEFPNARYEELPFDQVDLLAADLRRPKEAATAATPEALERGRGLVQIAVTTAGGSALTAIRGFEYRAVGMFAHPQGEFSAEVSSTTAFPYQLRQEIRFPGSTVVQVMDGEHLWVSGPRGVSEMPPQMLVEYKRGIDIDGMWGIYRQFLAGELNVYHSGEEEIEGKQFSVVVCEAHGQPIKLYFDHVLKMIVGARYRSTGPQGAGEKLVWLSDFRAVEGLLYPFKTVIYEDGAKSLEVTVSEFNLNPALDPATFAKP